MSCQVKVRSARGKRTKSLYRSKYIKPNKMTLIIGARFRDGVILVADRKISGREEKYGYKFITPIGNRLAFGCAGYLNKIQEFDRKVKDTTNQRFKELRLKNIAAYHQLGLQYNERIEDEEEPEKLKIDETVTKTKNESKEIVTDNNSEIYVYSTENFIDDCRDIISLVCTGKDNIIRNEVELLLILFSDLPKIYHLDSEGEAEEIVDFQAIGSGSPLVNYILKKHWRPDMDVKQIIKLCFFCIYYIQNLGIDNTVGIEENGYPDHLVIVNEEGNKYWSIKDNKEEVDKFIIDIKKDISNLKDTMDNLNF